MTPTFTGRIVEWDGAKGCGWIESDGQRIFLHRREFAEKRKRPEVGDVVRCTAGTGPTGELCAQNVVHLNDGGRFGLFAGGLLLALPLLPSAAIARFVVGFGATGFLNRIIDSASNHPPGYVAAAIAVVYFALINLATYVGYVRDKRQARNKEWRTPEAVLHVLELGGGWPAAFLAQRRLRHKCSKLSYQFIFWLIVLAWQLAAFDALNGWRWTQRLLSSGST